MKSKKIALFHPWIKSKGGAEKVILEILKKSKHKIDLYTWAYDKDNSFEEFKDYDIKLLVPPIGRELTKFKTFRGLFVLVGLIKRIPLEKYDKFFISTSGVAEFITFRNYKPGKTIAYVHTPLREANTHIFEWTKLNVKRGFVMKNIHAFSVNIYRFFEKRAWKKLDKIIFNSNLSKERAKESGLMKNREAEIIYPIANLMEAKNTNKKSKNFVYVSRLNPPKRQDLVIEAWKKFVERNPEYSLILVGSCEDPNYLRRLRNLADETKNVEIKVGISNKELEEIVSSSLAGLFFGYLEDFGIAPLEILNSGKPLIAVDEGGYVELISKHPNFYKIKEGHLKEKMIKNIEEGFEKFIKSKKVNKKGKIKINNFIEKIDKVLGE